LIEVVGVGGSGTVWLARDRRAGRDVAVKVIDIGTDQGRAERFEQEARALARLAPHPNVLAVRALGVGDDGQAWLVTDLVPGPDLADLIDAGGAIAAGRLLRIGSHLAAGLSHVHAAGVVHGDVTPANVLVGDGDTAVLADFGLAAVEEADDLARGHTPAYAAPERLRGGPPSAAGDVFGLGATLWAAATGAPPDAASIGPGRLDGPPRGIDAVLLACCHPEPTRRPTAAAAGRLLAAERRRRDRARPR
jgi:non-specific serine/threonine protein kinase